MNLIFLRLKLGFVSTVASAVSRLMTAGGSVEVEEFLLGCLRLRGQARAMDIAKLSFDQHWLIKNQGKCLVCRKLNRFF